MATKKEIKEHLIIALDEIGEIKPWFDQEVETWIFSHPNYPVEYGGESPEDVIQNYPNYLSEFIKHRLDNQLSPIVEKETKGRGGYRPGAGRPKGTTKEQKGRISVPLDVIPWLKEARNIEIVRTLMYQENSGKHPPRKHV